MVQMMKCAPIMISVAVAAVPPFLRTREITQLEAKLSAIKHGARTIINQAEADFKKIKSQTEDKMDRDLAAAYEEGNSELKFEDWAALASLSSISHYMDAPQWVKDKIDGAKKGYASIYFWKGFKFEDHGFGDDLRVPDGLPNDNKLSKFKGMYIGAIKVKGPWIDNKKRFYSGEAGALAKLQQAIDCEYDKPNRLVKLHLYPRQQMKPQAAQRSGRVAPMLAGKNS